MENEVGGEREVEISFWGLPALQGILNILMLMSGMGDPSVLLHLKAAVASHPFSWGLTALYKFSSPTQMSWKY